MPQEDGLENDWRSSIIQKLKQGGSAAIPYLKQYAMIQDILYHVGSSGVLAKCISMKEAEERLRAVHRQ